MTAPISRQAGETLLNLARKSIEHRFSGQDVNACRLTVSDSELMDRHQGVFVTLHKHGRLRGCIGNLSSDSSLVVNVKEYALHAAFKDPRFPPLTEEELSEVLIELSVLTPMVPLSYEDSKDLIHKIRPGVDGVTISKDSARATFLPQVWDQLPTHERFLEQLCLKAGLAPDEWMSGELDVSVYQVQMFEEHRRQA